ncbi:MAG: small conductance mechanosensitive channel [Rhodothermales bacterium]|jgi:small conductance mechanosensitive channel
MQDATALVESALVTIGQFIPRIAGVIVLLFVTFWVAKRAGKLVNKATAEKLDVTLAVFFGNMVRYFILTVGILACLRIFGVETTSFTALVGASSLAIGLAVQGTLSNFSSGVMLVIFRPFEVGDIIEVDGVTGKVAAIALFNTEIDQFDNKRVIVPNGKIFGNTITNINYHPMRRMEIAVGTTYGADIALAREVMTKAAASVQGVLPDPAPRALLMGLGGSSIDWEVRVWANVADFMGVKENVIETVKNALDAAEIGIPFPQLDVHMDKVDA